MPARLPAVLAAALAATAVGAPAASADTRTFETRLTVAHEVRDEDGRAEVRIASRTFRQLVVTRPALQILEGGDSTIRWPGRLSGPGCGSHRFRTVLNLSTEGRAFEPGFTQVVVSSGTIPRLSGFCRTPSGYERQSVPSTPLPHAPRVLGSMGVGERRTLKGTAREGRCPEDCSTTRVTLRLRRVG